MSQAVDPSDVITPDNWQEAARAAVESLPGDIQACVAWEPPTARRLALRITAEPLAGAPEGKGSLLELRWRDAVREQAAGREAASPGHAEGIKPYQSDMDWSGPVVAIGALAIGATVDLFAGRATVGTLIREVQAAILELLLFNGSETVSKDERNWYVLKDGRPVLAQRSQEPAP